ncbi:hypothetical protein CEXT_588131 [Caerostris extrusa]|uniref:Uncharacterized protein n=1 Tax=Caerostris extrusa TaxID=172846 RepID=A0AAV4XD35_CAEEX|nr:hypothetical protein CEXT_588131 [Caerostris extrusa]
MLVPRNGWVGRVLMQKIFSTLNSCANTLAIIALWLEYTLEWDTSWYQGDFTLSSTSSNLVEDLSSQGIYRTHTYNKHRIIGLVSTVELQIGIHIEFSILLTLSTKSLNHDREN